MESPECCEGLGIGEAYVLGNLESFHGLGTEKRLSWGMTGC